MLTIALLCTLGGFAMIAFAYAALMRDRTLRREIDEAVEAFGKVVINAEGAIDDGKDESDKAAQARAALSSISEYVKALAELAGNLSKVSQAVAALLISTILFGFAATLVIVDRAISDNGVQVEHQEPTSTAQATATPNPRCDFGGPYPKGGALDEKVLAGKQRDFATYDGLGLLSLSVTVELTKDRFKKSVNANRKRVPQQKYNYVISNEDCTILVAEWVNRDPSPIAGGVACAGGRDPLTPPSGIMIDWAPEEPYGSALVSASPPTPQSPCWLGAGRQKDGILKGVLDATSKHYMLAQGVSNPSYNKDEWPNAQVAYAGEILVNLDDCEYIVTENSGTYTPLGEFRKKVNVFFASKGLDASPAGTSTLPNRVPGCP